MEFITDLIIIVGIVINVMLFWKVWQMTGDVAKIKNQTNISRFDLTPSEIAIREILRGNNDIERVLSDALFADLCHAYNTNKPLGDVITKYQKLYKRADVIFPEYLSDVVTRQKFMEKIIWIK